MIVPPGHDPEDRPRWILPTIIVSQFAGTSIWFASNAILPDLQRAWGLPSDVVGLLTSAVQLGFITGTLIFAIFTVADRYSPRIVFFICSFFGAIWNLCILMFAHDVWSLFAIRFLTGISLAGVYPVGMKIASGWYRRGLGNALGFLVGALVLGTSFPHLLRSVGQEVRWETVIATISVISAFGGVLMLVLVPDGPYLVKGTPFNPRALAIIFRSKDVRSAAFGYFGHMWELYTFYAFLPFVIIEFSRQHAISDLNVSFWSFAAIAAGSIGCVGGGLLSARFGSARVAWVQLFCSGLLCLCWPMVFRLPVDFFLLALVVWGTVIVGDSPQFSALVAHYAPRELIGSALTISNSIGFAITIVSIQALSVFSHVVSVEYLFSFLAVGPVVGLLSSWRLVVSSRGREPG